MDSWLLVTFLGALYLAQNCSASLLTWMIEQKALLASAWVTTNTGGVIDMLEGGAATEKDFDKLEK